MSSHLVVVIMGCILGFGSFIAYPLFKASSKTYGMSGIAGCLVMIITILTMLAVGGIFLW